MAQPPLLKENWRALHEQRPLTWFPFLPPDNDAAAAFGAPSAPSVAALSANNASLGALLTMRFPRFLSYAVADHALRGFLDGFLRFHQRAHDRGAGLAGLGRKAAAAAADGKSGGGGGGGGGADATSADAGAGGAAAAGTDDGGMAGSILGELGRRVFAFFLRLVDTTAPDGGHLCLAAASETGGAPDASRCALAYGELLRAERLLPAPQLLDLCTLYGAPNRALASSLVARLHALQPGSLPAALRRAGRAAAKALRDARRVVLARVPAAVLRAGREAAPLHATSARRARAYAAALADMLDYVVDIAATLAAVARVSSAAAAAMLLAPPAMADEAAAAEEVLAEGAEEREGGSSSGGGGGGGGASGALGALSPLLHALVWTFEADLPIIRATFAARAAHAAEGGWGGGEGGGEEEEGAAPAGVSEALEAAGAARCCSEAGSNLVRALAALLGDGAGGGGGGGGGAGGGRAVPAAVVTESLLSTLHAAAEETDAAAGAAQRLPAAHRNDARARVAAAAKARGGGGADARQRRMLLPVPPPAPLLQSLDLRCRSFERLRAGALEVGTGGGGGGSLAAEEMLQQIEYLHAAVWGADAPHDAAHRARASLRSAARRRRRRDTGGARGGSGAAPPPPAPPFAYAAAAPPAFSAGAAAAASTPVDASAIRSVQELFPDLGDGFVWRCLCHDRFGGSAEGVINAMLEGALPSELDALDRGMGLEEAVAAAAAAAAGPAAAAHAPGSVGAAAAALEAAAVADAAGGSGSAPRYVDRGDGVLIRGKRAVNVFDNDEFETADFLDPSRAWVGKKRMPARYDAGSAMRTDEATQLRLRQMMAQYAMEEEALPRGEGEGGGDGEEGGGGFGYDSDDAQPVSVLAGGAGEYDDDMDDRWEEEGHWGVADSGGGADAAVYEKAEKKASAAGGSGASAAAAAAAAAAAGGGGGGGAKETKKALTRQQRKDAQRGASVGAAGAGADALPESLEDHAAALEHNRRVVAGREETAYWEGMRNTNKEGGNAKARRSWTNTNRGRGGRIYGASHGAAAGELRGRGGKGGGGFGGGDGGGGGGDGAEGGAGVAAAGSIAAAVPAEAAAASAAANAASRGGAAPKQQAKGKGKGKGKGGDTAGAGAGAGAGQKDGGKKDAAKKDGGKKDGGKQPPGSNPGYGAGMTDRQKARAQKQKSSRANHNRKAGATRKGAI